LNQLLEITVPKHLQEGGTMVIPGMAVSATNTTFWNTAIW